MKVGTKQQEELLKSAGAELKAQRLALSLSQEELSLRASMDQSLLSKVERLGPSTISWRNLYNLAAELNLAVKISFVPID